MEKIFQPKIVWINPNDIHGVEKRGEIVYPRAGYQKSDYTDAAIWIQRYKLFQDNGVSEEKLGAIRPMNSAREIFLTDMIRVCRINGEYYLGDDGRHRVKAAQDCMECKIIPVLLVEDR